MRKIAAIAPRYSPTEDRVELVINAGREDRWTFWVTRRLVLGMLDKVNQHLEQTSSAMARTPTEHRKEMAVMEKQMALQQMRGAIKPLIPPATGTPVVVGSLAKALRLRAHPKGFLVEILAMDGDQARGLVSRQELQTILMLMEKEARKGGWIIGKGSSSAGNEESDSPRSPAKSRAN
jgi:hypothetical protein